MKERNKSQYRRREKMSGSKNSKRDTKMSWGVKGKKVQQKEYQNNAKEEGERDSKTYTKTIYNKLYTKMSITKQKTKRFGY